MADSFMKSTNAFRDIYHRLHSSLTICQSMVSLKHLDLSSNNLTAISSEVMRALPSLTTLNLSANNISDISGLADASSLSIVSINLSHNSIKSGVNVAFTDSGPYKASLQEVDLRDNLIETHHDFMKLSMFEALTTVWLQSRNGTLSNPVCRGSKYYSFFTPFPPSLQSLDGLNIDEVFVRIKEEDLYDDSHGVRAEGVDGVSVSNPVSIPSMSKIDTVTKRFFERTVASIQPTNGSFLKLENLANEARMGELENKFDQLLIATSASNYDGCKAGKKSRVSGNREGADSLRHGSNEELNPWNDESDMNGMIRMDGLGNDQWKRSKGDGTTRHPVVSKGATRLSGASDATVKQLLDKIESLTAALRESENRATDLTKKVGILEARSSDFSTTSMQTSPNRRAGDAALEEERDSLLAKLLDACSERERAELGLASAGEKVDRMQIEIDDYCKLVTMLKHEVSESNKSKAVAEDLVSALRSEVEKVQAENDKKVVALKTELEASKALLSELQIGVGSKDLFIKTISTRLTSAESDLSVALVDLSTVKKESDILLERLTASEETRKRQEETLARVNQENIVKLSAAHDKVMQLEHQVRSLNLQIESEKAESNSSANDGFRLQGAVAALEKANKEAAITYEMRIQSLQERLNAVNNASLETLNKAVEEERKKQKKIEGAYEALARKTAEYKQLLKDVVLKDKKKAHLIQQLTDLVKVQKSKIEELVESAKNDATVHENALIVERRMLESNFESKKNSIVAIAEEEKILVKKECEEKVAEYDRKLIAATRHLDECKSKYEGEMVQCSMEVVSLREAVASLSSDKGRLENQVSKLLAKEDNSCATLKIKDQMLEDQNGTIKDLRDSVKRLESDMQTMEKKWRRRLEETESSFEEEASYRQAAEEKLESQEEIITHLEGIIDELKSTTVVEEMKNKLQEKDEMLKFVDGEVKTVKEMFKRREECLLADHSNEVSALDTRLKDMELKYKTCLHEYEMLQTSSQLSSEALKNQCHELQVGFEGSKHRIVELEDQIRRLLIKMDKEKGANEKKLKQVQALVQTCLTNPSD
jgi:chromosome segregation ATPase